MPAVLGTAYYTAGQVATLVQQLLNDQAGVLFTLPPGPLAPPVPNTVNLLFYMQAAYRKVQAALANIGDETFKTDNVQVVVPAVAVPDPGYQASILYSTAPPNQLPSNLITPLKLWERPDGSTDDYAEMIDMTDNGGLPSIIQQETLGMWEWRMDGIYLIGATLPVQVRIRFQSCLADPTDATSVIAVGRAINVVAYFTAALAAGARGAPNAAQMEQKGDDALEDLICSVVKRDQSFGRRRRSYSYRSGRGTFI